MPLNFKVHAPHNNRRARFHDYKAPCIYMITINKSSICPDFSTLDGNLTCASNPPHTVLYPVGKIIDTLIRELNSRPEFIIHNHVIMPDHVHILWRVTQWLEKDFGYHVGLFKSRCAKFWHESGNYMASTPVFAPKFNDRIAFSMKMFERFDHYISDNPRRRLTVMRHPELFTRTQSVRINDRIMDVYGNFQLLKHPIISPVTISCHDTPEESAKKWREWEETTRSGGVLISPFISRFEKEVMEYGIAGGASIIRIIPDGLGPKYKPSGREFDLYSEGRCLHVGPPRMSAHRENLSRSVCLGLNAVARWIASHPAERMALLNANR